MSGRELHEQHRRLLEDSAIRDDVATERGYFSVHAKRDLEALGFGRSQQVVPTLMIPIYGVVNGEPPWYIHRPDEPRIKDGRPRKYEIPAGRKMSLDIHPRVRPNLANPALPLFVTEGSRKVDALITAGASAVVGVIGVWNWRGRNHEDGLALLPDWEWVALKEGRQVYVLYDSDVMLKEPVHQAMGRMGAALKRMGASVAYCYLPAGAGGAKVGADDFLASGRALADIVALASPELRKPTLTSVGDSLPPNQRSTRQHSPPLAHEGDILARLARDLRAAGHVGEERAAKLLYLVATSRLLDKIVSAVVKGPSAGGKSAVVERVLGFFPEEAYYSLSGMSERALAYSEEPLQHRILVVFEAAGLTGDWASYLMRSLLSEGRIRYEVAESTSEGVKVRLIEREGPTGLIVTTTAVSLHAENETRLISIPVDDSAEQTGRVMKAIASGNGRPVDVSGWHELQYWLADGERRVEVPYAKALAELIPPVSVRLRRDFGSLLGLVRAHALLHRASRDTDGDGAVVADVEDYAAVRELVVDLISDAIGATVSEATRETVSAVAEIVAAGDEYASNAQLAERLEIDKAAVSRRVRVAIGQGYLRNDEDRRGKPSKLALADPLPEDVEVLPTVDVLTLRLGGDTPPSTSTTPDFDEWLDQVREDADPSYPTEEDFEQNGEPLWKSAPNRPLREGE
jgi:hypothetical protein